MHPYMYSGKSPFDISLLLGDPFALSTLSISAIGWIVAFGGSISSSVMSDRKFPNFSWWGIVFQLLIIVGIFYLICTNNIDPYRFALLAFLSTGTVYSTNSTNNFVYKDSSSGAAAAAGYILISIVNIVWMLYFGTAPDTRLHLIIDSYSIHKAPSGSNGGANANNGGMNPLGSNNHNGNYNNDAAVSSTYQAGSNATYRNPLHHSSDPFNPSNSGQRQSFDQDNGYKNGSGNNDKMRGSIANNNFYSSTQLPGLDTITTAGNSNHDDTGNNHTFSSKSPINGSMNADLHLPNLNTGINNTISSQKDLANANDSSTSASGGSIPPIEYPYRAIAIYSYKANPEDANEISFEKGELLEISDISGRWWQARRVGGEVGICPSNYVELRS
ncbi:hypothetical protein NADFUDRAFT_40457 [Nadsonia fulvescens var. elongata DSM 6958]|uniref:High osmolarity signaling protein SHO1 n=1 Tax=Nadsonia fulvescens var. elongata DSM 6958 TaxID=857566 RepID=A0A1E3PPE8_9ASCO|nr:hypothetical protein NADFUDRAFT_40457 [Nadsonia fulvescens var. elongata DSM 6958]